MPEIRKIDWLEADVAQRARIEERYRSQVEGLISELEAQFPTREIVAEGPKGNFRDRLSACSRDLGYKTWKDFAIECGFKVDGAGDGVSAIVVGERVDYVLWSAGKKADDMLAKIAAWYPDGDISTLKKDHDKSVENLSKFAQNLGYESWRDLLADCGYDVSKLPDAKGGRPKVTDTEALVAELLARYEGRPKPTSMKQLKGENPDLCGKLKTFMNAAKKEYGDTGTNVLIARGVIEGDVRLDAGANDDAVRSLVQSLEEEFSPVPNDEKPKSLKDLFALKDDRRDLLEIAQRRSPDLFGDTLAKALKARGVLRVLDSASSGGPAKVELSEEEVERLLADIAARYEGRVRESSLSAFEEANPDYKASSASVKRYLKARGMTAKQYLEERELISRVVSEDSIPRPSRDVIDAFAKSIDAIGPEELRAAAPKGAKWYEIESCIEGSVRYGSARSHEMIRIGDSLDLFVNEYGLVAATFCGQDLGLLNRDDREAHRLVSRVSYPEENGITEGCVRAVVTGIAGGAKKPRALISVYFAEDASKRNVIDGMLLSRDGSLLIECAETPTGRVGVPEGVREIAPYAFEGKVLPGVDLPGTLEVVGKRAFFNTNLSSVFIPASVKRVGAAAFGARMDNFFEPRKVPKITVEKGSERFEAKNGSLIEIDGEDRKLVHLHHRDYDFDSISLSVPKGVTTIALGSVSEGLCARLHLPEGLVRIDPGAFESVTLEADEHELVIPSTLIDAGDDFWRATCWDMVEEVSDLPPGVERAFKCPANISISPKNPRFYYKGEVVYVRPLNGEVDPRDAQEPMGDVHRFAFSAPSGESIEYEFVF